MTDELSTIEYGLPEMRALPSRLSVGLTPSVSRSANGGLPGKRRLPDLDRLLHFDDPEPPPATSSTKKPPLDDNRSAYDSFLEDMGMTPSKPKLERKRAGKNVTFSARTEPKPAVERRSVPMKPDK